jgi:hypothetical protein
VVRLSNQANAAAFAVNPALFVFGHGAAPVAGANRL